MAAIVPRASQASFHSSGRQVLIGSHAPPRPCASAIRLSASSSTEEGWRSAGFYGSSGVGTGPRRSRELATSLSCLRRFVWPLLIGLGTRRTRTWSLRTCCSDTSRKTSLNVFRKVSASTARVPVHPLALRRPFRGSAPSWIKRLGTPRSFRPVLCWCLFRLRLRLRFFLKKKKTQLRFCFFFFFKKKTQHFVEFLVARHELPFKEGEGVFVTGLVCQPQSPMRRQWMHFVAPLSPCHADVPY